MLLKKIEIKDFRQFRGVHSLKFSTDKTKNVTIIMGPNGSGKTTLAQAFTWCLYGDTDFNDKNVLNRAEELQLQPGEHKTVEVKISLVHNNLDYLITRQQRYSRDNGGVLRQPSQTKFGISFKQNDGQREFVDNLQTDYVMREILPKELSRYFFFDGERIQILSEEIRRGKSKEFSEAVKSLLGLGAMLSAINHLDGPYRRNSVVRNYKNSYDIRSNQKIKELTEKINYLEIEIDKIDGRVYEINEEINTSEIEIEKLQQEISENKDSEIFIENINSLVKQNMLSENHILTLKRDLFAIFNEKGLGFLAQKLINNALKVLSEEESLDKGIPDIHARTIKYLFERGFCICGTEINGNEEVEKELNEVLKFIPPQSLGVLISQFSQTCEGQTRGSGTVYKDIREKLASIREEQSVINDNLENIELIEEKLGNMKNVGTLQAKLSTFKHNLEEIKEEKEDLILRKGGLSSDLSREETSRKNFSLKDENNRRVEIYLSYAKCLHEKLKDKYSIEEEKVRRQFQDTINSIFKKIYDGGMDIEIDDKYNITLSIIDHPDLQEHIEAEASTAQLYSVILAFIGGVIQMARESNKIEETMLISEPYPLVMDAPLSSFDTKRIQTVCDVLPKVAEQVILFTKDTDGNLAEEHMQEKIGQRYVIVKKSELESHLQVGGWNV